MNQAANEIELDTLEGERGLPAVNARKTSSSAKKGLGILFLVTVLLLGAGFVYFYIVRKKQAAESAPPPKSEQLENRAPTKLFADAPPPLPEAPQEVQDVPAIGTMDQQPRIVQPQQTGVPAGEAKPRPRLDKSAASLMVGEDGGGSGATGSPATAAAAPGGSAGPGILNLDEGGSRGGSASGGLGSMLSGASTPLAVANRLADRNFTLAKGAFITASSKRGSTRQWLACRRALSRATSTATTVRFCSSSEDRPSRASIRPVSSRA